MKKQTINAILRIMKRAKIDPILKDQVVESTADNIIKLLAENHSNSFVLELESLNKKAAQAWECYASNPNVKDSSEYYYNIMEELVKPLNITLDYPGLYVTYELTRNGRKLTEYSALNAIRQFNNYWNHW